MYYDNSTEFYISLALFALLFIGGYLIDHHHEKLGVKVITPIILLACVCDGSTRCTCICLLYLPCNFYVTERRLLGYSE